MNDATQARDPFEPVSVDLKDPFIAAVSAWLWPGAGHVYQGRYAKAILYMVCILGTYFFGLSIGGSHVVYASFTKQDRRLPYLCQIGVGIPAMPALLQWHRERRGQLPVLDGFMAPPVDVPSNNHVDLAPAKMADRHVQRNFVFELGTVFTMVAGLLNILAIYDAGCGPAFVISEEKADKPPPD